MKNKNFTYALIAAVLVVWGVIIYRIFLSMAPSDDETPAIADNAKKEVFNDYAVPKDTSKLLLNYRDPFGVIKVKDTTQIPVSKLIRPQVQVIKQPAPVINWAFIQYAGYMRNVGSKKLIAIVNINGKSRTMYEGENAEGVKLIKNFKDSIKVSFNGKTKCIVLKTAAL